LSHIIDAIGVSNYNIGCGKRVSKTGAKFLGVRRRRRKAPLPSEKRKFSESISGETLAQAASRAESQDQLLAWNPAASGQLAATWAK
jgi:hypothetical protein